MNHSFYSADRTTHLKIVVVALVAGIAMAGFGISAPEHARAAAELVDGIVVGSRAIEAAEDGPQALATLVASLRDALDVATGVLDSY